MNDLDLIQLAGHARHRHRGVAGASQSKRRREIGFWCFLISNALWIVWGWHDRAYALIALQVALAALNIRGAYKNEPHPSAAGPDP